MVLVLHTVHTFQFNYLGMVILITYSMHLGQVTHISVESSLDKMTPQNLMVNSMEYLLSGSDGATLAIGLVKQ